MLILDDLKKLVKELIQLANAHLKYYQIAALEKLIELFSKFVAILILLVTTLVVWLFLSVWLSFSIGNVIESNALGFLIMALVNLLLGLLLYSMRMVLFVNPLLTWLSALFTKKKETQNGH